MKKTALFAAMTFELATLTTGYAYAQPVSSSCVGERMPDGSVNRAGCNPSPAPSAPSQGSGSGLTPAQQMQLQGARDVGSAIGTGISNMLFGSPQDKAAQERRALIEKQEQQQLLEQERRRREAEQIRARNQSDRVLTNLKDDRPEAQRSAATTAARRQAKAIDCAMSEVYQAAQALGSAGPEFAEGLRQDIRTAQAALARRPPSGEILSFTVLDPSQDYMRKGPEGEIQMVAHVGIVRDEYLGEVHVSINYSLTKNGQEQSSGDSLIHLHRTGALLENRVSPMTSRCLASLEPPAPSNASNASSATTTSGPVKTGDGVSLGGLQIKKP
jgi:hypothetical protein